MTQDDSRLRGLTALARKMPHAESPRRDVASFERFEDRLLQRRFGRQGRRATFARAALGSALVVLCLGAWWVRPRLGDQPAAESLRYAVQASSAADGPQRFAFSDGSHVVLGAEAAAQVAELSPHGARVRLARGHAEVSIARRKLAAWQFQAGPYTVRVTGTAFKLSWSEERQEIEVGMHHGSVVVTGPLAPDGVVLRGGQHLVACDRTRRLLVEDWSKVASAQVARAESARVAARAQSQRARAKPAAKEAASAAGEHDWPKRVAQGDFESVLREAAQLGERRVLASAGAPDLTALADAARYAGKTKLGRAALLALRERHPEADMARDSAFFLGRLGHGDDALAWYDRYLREQPAGTYVAQALGRSMMLRYEQGDAQRAAELASRYLARFPGGPYATSARKLSESARVLPPPP
jgi:hypothetical protein